MLCTPSPDRQSLPCFRSVIPNIPPDIPDPIFLNSPSLPFGDPVDLGADEDDSDEAIEAEKAIYRLKYRMAHCGQYYRTMQAGSGDTYSWQFRCGRWRDGCIPCLKIRAKEFSDRGNLIRSLLGPRLRIRQLSIEASEALRKLIPASSYWRIPNEQGDIVLWDADTLDEPGNLSYEDLDWTDLCKTPGRKRTSGKLGTVSGSDWNDLNSLDDDSGDDDSTDGPGTPNSDNLSITVRVPHVMASLPKDHPYTLSQLWDCAAYGTGELDPAYDKVQLEIACRLRVTAYKDLILQHGGRVIHTMRRETRLPYYRYNGWSIPDKPEKCDDIYAHKAKLDRSRASAPT